MRRFAGIFFCLILWLLPSFHCGGQIDSARLAALDARLEEYFRTLEDERADVKSAECDLLIESARDSVLRRHIALKIYGHYLDSPVMGDEAVAIHLTDRWFAPGLIDMGGEGVLLNANIYADFNRQSLIGKPAPVVQLETPAGEKVEVGGRSARYRVLFFYDTECAKCRLETIMLRSKLTEMNWPIDVYAVYTGVSHDNWKEWREARFTVDAVRTRVVHLWDPEISSDYQMKYGVTQTPRMFLLDRSGTIVGRGLDTSALERLLRIFTSAEDYEYGGSSSSALMDNLFASYGRDDSEARPHDQPGQPDVIRVLSMAKILESRTLAIYDTLSFKHLEGDLLYWLTSRRDEVCKEGTLPFINEYILSRPGIWNTPDDTLKVVGLARMMSELLSRTPVGSRLPKARELLSAGSGNQDQTISGRPYVFPAKAWNRIRRKGGRIVFHTEGCPVCKAELAAADSLGLRVLDVNVDEIMVSSPGLAKVLLDTFDLSSMPFIVETGRNGIIRRRYVSFLPLR